LALVAALAVAGSLRLGTLRPIGFVPGLLSFAAYLPWGVFQQYLLNGYFLNRLRGWGTVTAVLFAAAHAPNWFLMAFTLIAGYGATLLYRRCRNLYVLGLAHAIIGFLLFMTVPDSVSHHLEVGPRAL
jgi:membrane protease YdiL (CAAX protease family)